jgi:hypothetical protein
MPSPKNNQKANTEPQQQAIKAKGTAFLYTDNYLPGAKAFQKLSAALDGKNDIIVLEGFDPDQNISFSKDGRCLWGSGFYRLNTEGTEGITETTVQALFEEYLQEGNTSNTKGTPKNNKKGTQDNNKVSVEFRLRSFLKTYTNCICQHDNQELAKTLSGSDSKLSGTPRHELYFELLELAKKSKIPVKLAQAPFDVQGNGDFPSEDVAQLIADLCYQDNSQTQTDKKGKKTTPEYAPKQVHIPVGVSSCDALRLALLQNKVEVKIIEVNTIEDKPDEHNLLQKSLKKAYDGLHGIDTSQSGGNRSSNW